MITINSYQRSGNVFFSLSIYSLTGISVRALHDSNLYYDHLTPQVAIFRNPVDAISSKIYKDLDEHILNNTNHMSELDIIQRELKFDVEEYKKYVIDAMSNKKNLVIISFNDIKFDSDVISLKVLSHFKIKLREKKVGKSMKELMTDEKLVDKYSGHLPREKDENRLLIEEIVRDSEDIKEAIDAYNSIEYTIF